MRKNVNVLFAVILMVAGFTFAASDAQAFRGWCRHDPQIRILENGDWDSGNAVAEVYGETDESWATGPTYFTIRIPEGSNGRQFRATDNDTWQGAALDNWYLVGPGFNGYNEYVRFIEVSALDFVSGDTQIRVSATVSSSDGSLDLRYKVNPNNPNLPSEYSDVGKINNPPSPLQTKI